MRSRLLCLFLVCAIPSFMPLRGVGAQGNATRTYDLTGREARTHYLEVDAPTVVASFAIDTTQRAQVSFGSASKTLRIEITSPGGLVFASDGASTPQCTISVVADPASPETGAYYEFDLQAPPPGNWSYSIVDTAGTTEPRGVLVNILSDSPIQATMFGGGEEYRVGDTIEVGVMAVERPNIIASLTITPTLERTDGEDVTQPTITFHDDGQGVDGTSSDGLFSAGFVLSTPGEYLVSAVLQGTGSQGHAFSRTVSALVTVHPVRADLLGTFSSGGIDPNGDSLYESIGISPNISVTTAGSYLLTVELASSNGKTLSASSKVSLSEGPIAPEVTFPTTEIRNALQVDGPYTVKSVRIYFQAESSNDLADEAFDLGNTQPFLLSQLQREAIELLPGGTAMGVDTNGNGKFERLNVDLPVRYLVGGSYQWAADLTSGTGASVASATGSGFTIPGGSNLHFEFDGAAIGSSGVDGPYRVRNLRVWGPASTTIAEALITPNYPASRFDVCSLTLPSNVTVTAGAGECGAVVTYPPATGQGACGTISYSHPSGSVFPVGTTTVSVTSTAGGSGSFTVTVRDLEAPTLTCPASITAYAAMPTGRTVSYTQPSAADNCSGASVSCSPASGSVFPVGVTTVTCTATDASSNTASCNFAISVLRGNDTPGVYEREQSAFSLRNSNDTGYADLAFVFGAGGLERFPIAGDWNGDGMDTIGLYDPDSSTFMANANEGGPADYQFIFGPAYAGWIPIVGDWNGNGVDTIGLYNPDTGAFYLRNSNSAGVADVQFVYGPGGLGWIPIVGDWNNDGISTVGLYDPSTSTFYLRNSNTAGPADLTFVFLEPMKGAKPVAGDWNADGTDTVGIFRESEGTWLLLNTNADASSADIEFYYGTQGHLPITGDWNFQ